VAIKSCLTEIQPNKENRDPVAVKATVGGYPFMKSVSTEGAAGSSYEIISYRGIVDGDCYAIEYQIHSTNIANYSPDQGIKPFDKSKIVGELEKMVKSFKFVVNSN
jgi:hypothetical protein